MEGWLAAWWMAAWWMAGDEWRVMNGGWWMAGDEWRRDEWRRDEWQVMNGGFQFWWLLKFSPLKLDLVMSVANIFFIQNTTSFTQSKEIYWLFHFCYSKIGNITSLGLRVEKVEKLVYLYLLFHFCYSNLFIFLHLGWKMYLWASTNFSTFATLTLLLVKNRTSPETKIKIFKQTKRKIPLYSTL